MPDVQVQISAIDIMVIVVYLVGIVSLGCWAGIRQRRRNSTGKGYFLAGQTLTWPLIGLALFSTNIQTAHLVGMAQEGYISGMVFGNLEWLAAFLLIVLALFFAPFYIRARVATLPDFLEKRYNSRPCRDWMAMIGIMTAIFFHIGMALYSGAVLFRNLFGVNMTVSILVLSILTAIYTTIGGLLAVVLTEAIQALVMLSGSAMLVLMGLIRVGGWSEMTANVDPVMMTVLRGSNDPSGMPWYAAFLGYPVLGLWYWCADQTIVQRVLGAKDEHHARLGPLFCEFLKILPVFLFTLPGILLMAMENKGLFPPIGNSKDTYGFLVQNLLPTGLKGLMAAAMLAAVMGAVSGALNSTAVLFTYDVYKRLRPNVSDQMLTRIGRRATVAAMVLGILWAPVVGMFPSIMRYVLAVVCHISPPITTVFVWGVFSKRVNSSGAVATLYLGSALCCVAFFLTSIPGAAIISIPPLMDCFYLFVVCSVIHVCVSMVRPQKLTTEQAKLVWEHPFLAFTEGRLRGIGDYRLVAGVLTIVMVVLYTTFA